MILAPNGDGAATLNNSVVPSGQTTEVALKTPSAVQTGIKVNTRAPFTVEPGTLVDLVLDFNACKSVVTTGKGNGNPHASGYLRSEEHTSELQSLMRISYAVFCLKKKKITQYQHRCIYKVDTIKNIYTYKQQQIYEQT